MFTIFSDECYIFLDDKHGQIFVTRRPDEEFDENCIVPSFKQSPIRIMVWGCIIAGRKGPLLVLDYPGGRGGGMTAGRYQTQVLDGVLHRFYDEVKEERGLVDFQQDGAPSHRAKSTIQWFKTSKIPLADHPAQSPDLNPMELVWHELKDTVRSLGPITTAEGLKQAVHKAWDLLPIKSVDKHIFQMPDRVEAVLAVKGGHTRF